MTVPAAGTAWGVCPYPPSISTSSLTKVPPLLLNSLTRTCRSFSSPIPLFLLAILALLQPLGVAGSVLNKKQVLMGHLAYDSRNYYPLSQTPDYDVVAISFLAFSSATHLSSAAYIRNNVGYAPFYPEDTTRESEDVFKASIKDRTSRGRLVQMSIFYYNPVTVADRQQLIDVVNDVVAKYGVTGVDISSLITDISLDPGDTDYANPKTAAVKNIISAIKTLKSTHGSNFTVTMTAPLSTVQGGHSNYSSTSGAFIPIIDALRDEIDIVCPSNANVQTPVPDLDGTGKDLASIDSHVSMPDMLLNGFSVAGSNPKPFAPLREDQVCVSAFGAYVDGHYGYVSPSAMQSVVTCLTQGSGCGTYKPKAGPYPDFRGMYVVSIHDDQTQGGNFYASIKSFLETLEGNSDGVAVPPPRNTSVEVSGTTASSVSGSLIATSPTGKGSVGRSCLSVSTSSANQSESDPISTESQPRSSSSEITSTAMSKKSLEIVAAVIPVVVVIIAGITFFPLRKCRERRRARRGLSQSPRNSDDSDDSTLEPYIMARTRPEGAQAPLDSKSAAYQQVIASPKSGHAAPEASESPIVDDEAALEALRMATERAGISITQLVGSLNSVHHDHASAIGTRAEVTDSDRPPTYEAGSRFQTRIEGSTSHGPSLLR